MSNYKTNLQLNNEALNSNNLDLQSLIDQANALPDAGGVELPELNNEGSASDLLYGKQLISQEGNIVEGAIETFDGSYECSDESTGGSSSGVVCPSLTIYGNCGWLSSNVPVYLHKVVYYSNGELQTLTAYDEFNEDGGLEYNLIAQPYMIHNVDIDKPIVIEGRVDAHNAGTGDMSKNINIIFQSTEQTELEIVVFTITDTNPAFITIEPA